METSLPLFTPIYNYFGDRPTALAQRCWHCLSTVGAPDENSRFRIELSPDGRRVAMQRTLQNNGYLAD